jgi:hypothetical protein
MTTTVPLARRPPLLVVSRVATIGLTTIAVVLTARLLGVEQYGLYSAAAAVGGVLTYAGVFGADQLFLRVDFDLRVLQRQCRKVAVAIAFGGSIVHSGRRALAGLCPHGNAGGITPQRFQAPLSSLLNDAEYQRASLAARSEAFTRLPAGFKRRFREVVARLLNSSCGSG